MHFFKFTIPWFDNLSPLTLLTALIVFEFYKDSL